MTLQASGEISLANVQTEFGGSNPISISEYYGVAGGVPASGTISLYDFYGKSAAASPAFPGWSGSPPTMGESDVYSSVNTSNSFTGNTVTPGAPTRFYLSLSSPGSGSGSISATLRFYVAGSLVNTFTTSNSSYTPVIGSSPIRFESTLTDTDPYYGGGQGHYAPTITIYAIFTSESNVNIGFPVYRHDFDYAIYGDPDYDD